MSTATVSAPVSQQRSHHSDTLSLSNNRSSKGPSKQPRFGEYILIKTLGQGEFGKVKLGTSSKGNSSNVAIKLIKRNSIPQGSEKETKIHREITALKKLRHPNIVRLVEVLQNDKYIGIVLEYAPGGELFDYITKHSRVKEVMACKLFAQLISAIDYMHAKGLVHRDLKLENLLLDQHKNILVSDFGFVNSFNNNPNDLMKTSCGSPCYAAPELVVSSNPYEGRKADVWSLGVILYSMLAGYLPFDDDPQNPGGTNLARLYHYITNTPLKFPEYIQPTPRDLLRKILVPNPKRRLNLQQVKSHSWLAIHRDLLSVTPAQWDKNYKTMKMLNKDVDKLNRRFSLMDTPSTSSAPLMFNKGTSSRSYSSNNLYSNPAEPQTSKTVALPSAEASPVSSPDRQKVNESIILDNDNQKHSLEQQRNQQQQEQQQEQHAAQQQAARYRRHSRTGSSASVALQAVVEADVEIKRRYSSNAPESNLTPIRNTQRPISLMPVPYTSSESTRQIDTINESPESKKMAPPPIPISRKIYGASSSPSSTSVTPTLPSNSAFSGRHKPRPTSYHPSHNPSFFAPGTELSFNVSETSLTRQGSGNDKNPKPIYNSDFATTNDSLASSAIIEEPFIDMNQNNDTTSEIPKPSPVSVNIAKEKNHKTSMPPPSTTPSNKHKRFSLLTFYQMAPEPSPSDTNLVMKPEVSSSSRIPPVSSRKTSPDHTHSSQYQRNRVSSISKSTIGEEEEPKEEISTTRKVMDFFRRRSTRI